MAEPFILGDGAVFDVPNGTRLGNLVVEASGSFAVAPESSVYQITQQIFIAPEQEDISGFKMPEIYLYYPEDAIRRRDTTLVERQDVPVFAWDSVPKWDNEPFTWDEVIGPEPILRTTTRIQQMELEKTCCEITRLLTLKDANETPKEFLPYLAAEMGTPLPSTSERAQRSFLKRLADTYRKKGTPAALRALLATLGFDVTLVENYQRKADGAIVVGPQIRQGTTNLVAKESAGVTQNRLGPYRFNLAERPIQRGSVRLEIFSQSETTPIVVRDDSEGGWSALDGFIDYETGRAEVTLDQLPALIGQPIQVTYRFFFDQFPDPFGNRFTDRYRSSIVDFAFTPQNPSVSLTEELLERLFLYLSLMKPAHITTQGLDLILLLTDDVVITDELQPLSYLWVESLFGTLYMGDGWAAEDNGSLPTSPAREGPEFLVKVPADDPTREPKEAPYVYPFKMNGAFVQPHAGGTGANPGDNFEADWVEDSALVFEALVTNDVAPTTTNFSIAKGAGTALGVGDDIALNDTLGTTVGSGEQRIIQIFTDNGTHFDVTVTVGFPVAPPIGEQMAVLSQDGVKMNGLDVRQQDPLEMKFGQTLSPAPDGISVGPFSDTIVVAHRPVDVGSTSILRFTIGATVFEETATGTGAFTNTSTFVSVSSIDYTTGAVSVTFTSPPDTLTVIEILTNFGGNSVLGGY